MLEWSQRWCEEVQRESEHADQTNMERCPNTTSECCNRDAVETLSWFATVGKIRTEQECEMFRRRHEHGKSSMQTVIIARQRPTKPREMKLS